MNWLRRVWTRLRWRRALAPLPMAAGDTIVTDLRIVVVRQNDGKTAYEIRTPDGQPAGRTALADLFTAVADMGCSIPGLHGEVKKACRKLSWALNELARVARASVGAASARP